MGIVERLFSEGSSEFELDIIIKLTTRYFCVRYNLPIIIVVVNNSGIYSGVDPATWDMLRDGQDNTLA